MNSIFRGSLVVLCLVSSFAFASTQPTVQADRVAVHPDLRATTPLRGQVPTWAVSANDRGAVPADTSLRLTFVLSRSPELQASFTQLLADQQDPNSPSYHQWMTPQQVGERYGPTQHDLDALTNWLDSQGLTVIDTTPSRIFVSVVAPASKVASALATSFHSFNDNGKSRMSATADPVIPSAFASIVASISGLADTDIRPMHHGQAMAKAVQSEESGVQPQNNINSLHYIAPADFSVIFDMKPVTNAGYTGAGQKVAIIGRSRVATTDISQFESVTGLPNNLPNVIIPKTGADPGTTNNGDQAEATLDVERVIGTAPGIQADLVVSSNAGGGIYAAALYQVETVLDPVMTISFGSCEAYAGASAVGQWDTLFALAASEGISVFVSSGDSGAAGCDGQFQTPPAYQFRSINYICASSYVTCVGGTEFVEGSTQYWSSTNGTGLVSALGYIPEGAWNEPGSFAPYVAASGGGGASIYVPKPAWQTGAGVPADNARDVPDVSFPSSLHDAYYGCYAAGNGDCAANRYYYYYGTSAGTPSMAAVTALLNQKMGGSQGNLNPLLYRLAASNPNSFHDATPATIYGTVCTISTPSVCNNSTPSLSGLNGGLAGYALTTGYDQATGLGSLDIANFINSAASISKSNLAATTFYLKNSPSTISNTQTTTLTAFVTSTSSVAPTGTVQFYGNGSALGTPVPIASGMAVTAPLPFPAAGVYFISATYSGDSTYASSTAAGYQMTVTGLPSTTKLTLSTATVPVGTTETFTATVTPGSGSVVPTGTVRFFVPGATVDQFAAVVPLSGGTAVSPPITFSYAGDYAVTAMYVGDSVYSKSNSSALPMSVQKLPSALRLSDSADSIGIGGGISSFVVIPNVQGSTAPGATGNIQVYSNGVPLGAPLSLPPALFQTAQASSPVNIFSTPGVYTITATYSGDANWMPGTAAGVTLTVLPTPAYYQLSVSRPTMTLRAGDIENNVNPVDVASELGFVGTVNLSCSVAYGGTGTVAGAPTCSLSSNTVTFPLAPGPSPVLTINTTARSNARRSGLFADGGAKRGRWWRPGEVALCALLLCFVPRRRRWRSIVMLLVLAVGFNGLSGCSGSNGAPKTPIGTTAGNYTVTVTASSTVAGAPVPPPATVVLTIN